MLFVNIICDTHCQLQWLHIDIPALVQQRDLGYTDVDKSLSMFL